MPKFGLTRLIYPGASKQFGSILLNMGSGPSDVLIGMEFLRTFQKTLIVFGGQHVALIDNADIATAIQDASQQQTSAQLPQPPIPQA
jgi:hypothetical protein